MSTRGRASAARSAKQPSGGRWSSRRTIRGIQPAGAGLSAGGGRWGGGVHHHQHALSRIRAGGEAHRGEQVGQAVGLGVVGGTHGAGEHHRLPAGTVSAGKYAVSSSVSVPWRITTPSVAGSSRRGAPAARIVSQPSGVMSPVAVEGEHLLGGEIEGVEARHGGEQRATGRTPAAVAGAAGFRIGFARRWCRRWR